MKIFLALAACLFVGSAAAGEFCAGHVSSIAPDAQILEMDLTQQAAVEAAELLADRIRQDSLEGEAQLGVLNARKTIDGYLLRREAERSLAELGPADPAAVEARGIFCNWLATDGFWYD